MGHPALSISVGPSSGFSASVVADMGTIRLVKPACGGFALHERKEGGEKAFSAHTPGWGTRDPEIKAVPTLLLEGLIPILASLWVSKEEKER